MTARGSNTALENITRGLNRTNLPRLPPAFGFDGDQEYLEQVDIWKRWIRWEHEDPMVLRMDEPEAYKQRVLYVYKQAVMALRFWPEIWVEAAEFCFSSSLEKEGNDFLSQGISANPESSLLAFKHADRLETVLPLEEGDEGLASRGASVRAPYDKLLDALYDLIKKVKTREADELLKIEELASLEPPIDDMPIPQGDDDDDDVMRDDKQLQESVKAQRIKQVQLGYAAQTRLLSRTISFGWIALMRAMRRVQGKGKVGATVGGSRQIFTDARQRGRITSDVYMASALIEHHVYKDPAATKIFERGAKLFPEDEVFILEYLKHLLAINDTTNARAVFETAVNRLTQKPELVAKSKVLYVYFHKYEAEYGELSQIAKLEQRMADLFPEDPKLKTFASRYATEGFDPTAVRPIISPLTQMRPKAILPSIEQHVPAVDSPRPQYAPEAFPAMPPMPPMPPMPTLQQQYPQQPQQPSPRPNYAPLPASPKRPFDDSSIDVDAFNRPRKAMRSERGDSPLKGAAGRRLDQQRRLQANAAHSDPSGSSSWSAPAPFVIPRDITFLLSIIPRAELYNATRFNPEAMVRLLNGVQMAGSDSGWRQPPVQSNGSNGNGMRSTFYHVPNSDEMVVDAYGRNVPRTAPRSPPEADLPMLLGQLVTRQSNSLFMSQPMSHSSSQWPAQSIRHSQVMREGPMQVHASPNTIGSGLNRGFPGRKTRRRDRHHRRK